MRFQHCLMRVRQGERMNSDHSQLPKHPRKEDLANRNIWKVANRIRGYSQLVDSLKIVATNWKAKPEISDKGPLLSMAAFTHAK